MEDEESEVRPYDTPMAIHTVGGFRIGSEGTLLTVSNSCYTTNAPPCEGAKLGDR